MELGCSGTANPPPLHPASERWPYLRRLFVARSQTDSDLEELVRPQSSINSPPMDAETLCLFVVVSHAPSYHFLWLTVKVEPPPNNPALVTQYG